MHQQRRGKAANVRIADCHHRAHCRTIHHLRQISVKHSKQKCRTSHCRCQTVKFANPVVDHAAKHDLFYEGERIPYNTMPTAAGTEY